MRLLAGGTETFLLGQSELLLVSFWGRLSHGTFLICRCAGFDAYVSPVEGVPKDFASRRFDRQIRKQHASHLLICFWQRKKTLHPLIRHRVVCESF